MKPLMAAGSSPGVCNAGGVKQGCYDVDTRLIEDLKSILASLEAVPTPPRYVNADALLTQGLNENIKALELRNQAIAQNDQAAWDQHTKLLKSAIDHLQQAYEAYPSDNRPNPPP